MSTVAAKRPGFVKSPTRRSREAWSVLLVLRAALPLGPVALLCASLLVIVPVDAELACGGGAGAARAAAPPRVSVAPTDARSRAGHAELQATRTRRAGHGRCEDSQARKVIANFKLVDGKLRFPNQHGYHAAMFVKGEGFSVATGKPGQIIMFDQWTGKTPGPRRVRSYTAEQVTKNHLWPANIATDFYAVMVP
jgi:hypothetical protein